MIRAIMPGMSEKGEQEGGALSADLEDAARRGDTAYLLDALGSPEVQVRILAAERLGEVGGDKAGLALLTLARDRWGERPEVRIAALRALRSVQSPERYANTLEEFICAENRKVVSAARKILDSLDPGGYAARLVSRGCLDHNAIRTYGERREPTAVGLLAGYLHDRVTAGDATGSETWGKVYAGVRALGSIGGSEATAANRELDSALREEIGSLTGLKRERARKILGATEACMNAPAEG